METAIQLGILTLLILLNAGFALAEMALVSSRRAALTLLARKNVAGAVRARNLAEEPERFLPTVQVGITLIGVLTGVFGGARLAASLRPALARIPVLAPAAGSVSLIVTVLFVTFLTLVLGELVPKRLALRNPERIACLVAWPLDMLARFGAPIVWLLGATSNLVLRMFGPADAGQRAISEDELKAILAEGAESGMLESEERDMMERVLRLADKPVRAIMTPRQEIAWIDRTAPRNVIIAALKASPHSRFVVCDRVIDNVVGMVQAKDILDRLLDGKEISLAAALRQPLALPDTSTALGALEQLKADPLGAAIVLDEYGSFEGMITLGDLLEAIVGDAEDLRAAAGDASPENFEMDGLTPMDEVMARLGLNDPPAEGSYHTLAGLVLALLKRVPHKGDAILYGGWRFEVLAMDGRRVETLRVSRDPAATA